MELLHLWTPRKRPPKASSLGTGHHEGANSFNKLGELHMGPSQSLVQLHFFLDLELPQWLRLNLVLQIRGLQGLQL